MSDLHDDLMRRIESADPTNEDGPPPVGSNRYMSIEENIMQATRIKTIHTDHGNQTENNLVSTDELGGSGSLLQPIEQVVPQRSHKRGVLAWTAAFVAIAGLSAASIVGMVSDSATQTEPVSIIEMAAGSITDVERFRVRMEFKDSREIPGGVVEIEVDGDNARMSADGWEIIRIGDVDWTSDGGEFTSRPAAFSAAPFDEASVDILTAALKSNKVSDLGSGSVEGVEVSRYSIEIDDAARSALASVPRSSYQWFVGGAQVEIVEDADGQILSTTRSGFLEDAKEIEVWVADGLIHRISSDNGDESFTYTYYDFGADITITPPN